MKNLLFILLIILLSLNLSIIPIYAMGNSGNMGGGNNNGNNGNNGGNNGQGGGNANAGGNNPKAQANKNKNKNKTENKSVSKNRSNKKREISQKRKYRVREFCKKNKEACGTIRKQRIRIDEEKRLISIELIEAINRYRENNHKEK